MYPCRLRRRLSVAVKALHRIASCWHPLPRHSENRHARTLRRTRTDRPTRDCMTSWRRCAGLAAGPAPLLPEPEGPRTPQTSLFFLRTSLPLFFLELPNYTSEVAAGGP